MVGGVSRRCTKEEKGDKRALLETMFTTHSYSLNHHIIHTHYKVAGLPLSSPPLSLSLHNLFLSVSPLFIFFSLYPFPHVPRLLQVLEDGSHRLALVERLQIRDLTEEETKRRRDEETKRRQPYVRNIVVQLQHTEQATN